MSSEFRIILTFENCFGSVDSKLITVYEISDFAKPDVTAAIDGPLFRSLHVFDEFSASLSLTYPVCNGSGVLEMVNATAVRWIVLDGHGVTCKCYPF